MNSGVGCGQSAEVSRIDTGEHSELPPESNPDDGGSGASAAAGASGAGGNGGVAEAPNSAPNISGVWAMFDFEDPVIVSLTQDGSALTGRGCCTPSLDDSICCGNVADGSLVDGRARFEFPVAPPATYAADLSVSETGDRMTGAFYAAGNTSFLSAWVRVPDGQRWLSHDDDALA